MATLNNFKTLNEQELATVEGGNLFGEFVTAAGVCTTAGAIIGGMMFPSAGALPGAILGAQYCTGVWGIARAVHR